MNKVVNKAYDWTNKVKKAYDWMNKANKAFGWSRFYHASV